MDDQVPTDADFNLLSREQIDALADQFERDTGRTIDRAQFHQHMVGAVTSYWVWHAGPTASLSAMHIYWPDAKKASQAASRAAARFRLTLQRAFDAHERLLVAEDQIALRYEFKRLLQSPRSAVPRHGHFPTLDLLLILNDLDGHEKALDSHLALFRRPRSRPRESWWHYSIDEFAWAWWEATGDDARAPFRRRERDHGGKFVDWVASILDMINPGHNRDALGNRIRGALRAIAGQKSSQKDVS